MNWFEKQEVTVFERLHLMHLNSALDIEFVYSIRLL